MSEAAAPVTRTVIPQSMLDVPCDGLARRGGAPGKRVVVMGGGVAGLVAAYEL